MLRSTIMPKESMVLVWNHDSDDYTDVDVSRLGLKKVTIFGGNCPLNESLKKILSQRK